MSSAQQVSIERQSGADGSDTCGTASVTPLTNLDYV